MRPRVTTGLLSIIFIGTLSACGSGSDSPESIDDIRDSIEAAGYECDDPTVGKDDAEDISCGEDIYASWYQDAEDEVASYDALSSVYADVSKKVPISLYVIRGDQWRIGGDEAAVMKVADSLDKEAVSIGG